MLVKITCTYILYALISEICLIMKSIACKWYTWSNNTIDTSLDICIHFIAMHCTVMSVFIFVLLLSHMQSAISYLMSDVYHT